MRTLEVQNLAHAYSDGSPKALDGVEMSVEAGELMAIMGASGCGKTTLLLAILGAIHPTQGQIVVDGADITGWAIEDRAIGYVPQDFGLFPHLSVYENVAFGMRIRKKSPEKIEEGVKRLLQLVNLEDLAMRAPNELSGGQKQRVAIARALAIEPLLLLLDEPLSNVDEETKADVRQNLKRIQRETAVTAVCVTHNPEDAFELGDRIAMMQAGRIVQCDVPMNILERPQTEQIRRLIAPMYYLWADRLQ